MKKTVDLRGLMCPEPVLRAKKLLDDAAVQEVDALVESEVNVNNLQRLAKSMKVQFSSMAADGHFKINLAKQSLENANLHTSAQGVDKAEAAHSATATVPSHRHATNAETKGNNAGAANTEVGTVVLLSKDKFGEGDPDFSNNLLNMFLQTLLQSGHRPRAILMANTGVKLFDPETSTYKVLNDFVEAGVEVLACGLCVEYYGLKEKIPVQRITNMFAICEFLMAADKVIQP